MSKLPMWAWNKKTKKWEIFPYHLLEDIGGGQKGMSRHIAYLIHNTTDSRIEKLQYMAKTWPEHFKYCHKTDRLIYVEKPRWWIAVQWDKHTPIDPGAVLAVFFMVVWSCMFIYAIIRLAWSALRH
jgi:hypothetical protein